jgi:hypothetical protein
MTILLGLNVVNDTRPPRLSKLRLAMAGRSLAILASVSPILSLIGVTRAEIALNILGFLIGLYYAAIIKTRCPPASRCEALRAGGGQARPLSEA